MHKRCTFGASTIEGMAIMAWGTTKRVVIQRWSHDHQAGETIIVATSLADYELTINSQKPMFVMISQLIDPRQRAANIGVFLETAVTKTNQRFRKTFHAGVPRSANLAPVLSPLWGSCRALPGTWFCWVTKSNATAVEVLNSMLERFES